jgi:ATP-dependent Lon protease
MGDVLRHALVRMPEAITWDPDAKAETPIAAEAGEEGGATIAH